MGTSRKRRSAFGSLRIPAFALLLALLVVLVVPALAQTQNDWRKGSIVRLSKGTQIRQGPGLGYCYHTVVPEDDWAVQVINGPSQTKPSSDGRTWYDTSRKGAGDTFGGTGWVDIAQADSHPAPNEGGTYCPAADTGNSGNPGNVVTPTQTPTIEKPWLPKFLIDIVTWWNNQLLPVKLGIMGLAFAALFTSNRWGNKGNDILLRLIKAALWGVLLGGVADLTRQYWLSAWLGVAGGAHGIDLALALFVGPVLLWAAGALLNVASRAVGIGILVALGLLLLALIAPDRFSDLSHTIQGWLNRPPSAR